MAPWLARSGCRFCSDDHASRARRPSARPSPNTCRRKPPWVRWSSAWPWPSAWPGLLALLVLPDAPSAWLRSWTFLARLGTWGFAGALVNTTEVRLLVALVMAGRVAPHGAKGRTAQPISTATRPDLPGKLSTTDAGLGAQASAATNRASSGTSADRADSSAENARPQRHPDQETPSAAGQGSRRSPARPAGPRLRWRPELPVIHRHHRGGGGGGHQRRRSHDADSSKADPVRSGDGPHSGQARADNPALPRQQGGTYRFSPGAAPIKPTQRLIPTRR